MRPDMNLQLTVGHTLLITKFTLVKFSNSVNYFLVILENGLRVADSVTVGTDEHLLQQNDEKTEPFLLIPPYLPVPGLRAVDCLLVGPQISLILKTFGTMRADEGSVARVVGRLVILQTVRSPE